MVYCLRMSFGETPSIHERPALAEVRAQQVFESEMREIVSDPEAFATLERGIPERCLRYVVKLAQAVKGDGDSYRKATWNVRQWLTTTNGFYVDQYAPEHRLSIAEKSRHQETVEELFMLLGDPGYARLILLELEERDLLHSIRGTEDASLREHVHPSLNQGPFGRQHTSEEAYMAERPTTPAEEIDLLRPEEAATRRPLQPPNVSPGLMDLLDEINGYTEKQVEARDLDQYRNSGVRHVDGAETTVANAAGTRQVIPGKGQAEAIDFRLSDPWFM